MRILLCAPSNTAVDELTYRLLTKGVLDIDGKRRENLKIVRIGNPGGNKMNYRNKMQQMSNKMMDKDQEFNADIISIVENNSLDFLVEEKRY